MDLSKLNELKNKKDIPAQPVPDAEIERVAHNELENPVYQESLENGIELMDAPEEPVIDIDLDKTAAMHLTPDQEQKAEEIAVKRTVEWMRTHPRYTKEELKLAKAEFISKARKEIGGFLQP